MNAQEIMKSQTKIIAELRTEKSNLISTVTQFSLEVEKQHKQIDALKLDLGQVEADNAHLEAQLRIQKPGHIFGLDPEFFFGERVVNSRTGEIGNVVGLVYRDDQDQPRWEYRVKWAGQVRPDDKPCAPVNGYGYLRYDGTPKTPVYYDCEPIQPFRVQNLKAS